MYSKRIQEMLKKKNIKTGDFIRIEKAKTVHEGILMPRIGLGDTSCLVIKLSNGYNTGIKFKEGVRVEKIKEGLGITHKHKKKTKKIIFNKKLPIISILGTGGTIASKVDYRTGGVYASFSPEDIAMQIPELKEITNIKAEEVMNIMSEDMTPERWENIAKEVARDVRAGYKGIIVTHGTDTLHYTAAALSFMLKDLPCPVAVVGAQRSSDRGSSDTVMNIACAANFVANSDVAEVCTILHGTTEDDYCLAIRGTKSRKMHSSRRDAFRPINEQPIAKIHWKSRKIEIKNKNYRKRDNKKLKLDIKLNPKVALIKSYPGLDPEIFDFYLDKKYKGFVIEGTGLGHVPTLGKSSLLPKIEKIVQLGLPVVITSQCLYGRTHPTIYYNLRELSRRGAIFAEDMLPEVALVKLMWVLGHSKKLDKIRDMMLTNYVGEINPRIGPKDFLV